MKDVRGIIFGVTVGLAVLFPPWTYVGSRDFGKAYAQVSVSGTVTFAGVYYPESLAGGARAGAYQSSHWQPVRGHRRDESMGHHQFWQPEQLGRCGTEQSEYEKRLQHTSYRPTLGQDGTN
jgi:hypothetical protein